MNTNILNRSYVILMGSIVTLALVMASALPAITSAQELGRVRSYVAIGDSVASGLGLAPVVGATTEDTLCGRSSNAYSAVVATHLKDNAYYKSAACQGARVTHFSNPQPIGSANIAPQLDSAFADGTPRLISMTIGANDAQWSTFIGACFATDCNTQQYTDLANAYLAQLSVDLPAALANIAARSQGDVPAVVLTGYYNPMSLNCVALSGITAGEVAWLSNETAALNNTIKAAADQYGFATFAPIDFTGHDICSADSWIQRPGYPGEPAAFHPKVAGQQAMAQAVLAAAGNNPILSNN